MTDLHDPTRAEAPGSVAALSGGLSLFKRMKLGTRLALGFTTVCAIGAVVSALGINGMSRINEQADQLYERELMALSHIKEANINLVYAARSRRNAILSSTAEQREQFLAQADRDVATMREQLDQARPHFYKDDGKRALAALDAYLAEYDRFSQELHTKIRGVSLDSRDEITQYLFQDFGRAVGRVDDQLEALTRLKEANAQDAARETSELYVRSRNLMLTLVGLSLLAGVGLGVGLTRSVTRRLGAEPQEAAEVAERVARGDLSVTIPLRAGDDSSLMASLKNMQGSLLRVVSNVRQNAEGVATASAEIAQGNHDLSARTEEQASALEETAASMEQLSATVKTNADNARQANQLAASASHVAISGGEVVDKVVETMKGINDSSRKIADIIGVIDGIAFQTNILALNAAVEAARAGEQGRGFAVVATEVRNLAQRSAQAAKEIKSLIGTSVERVEQGSALVDEAGSTMKEVVASIRRVTDLMAEISAASAEQSAGVTQVGEAVGQMDQATQQNAALVEESAAAAESLRNQAQQLLAAVAVFKLSAQETQGEVATAAPASAALAPAANDAVRPAVAAARKPSTGAWDGVERRGPHRATNVVRPVFDAPAKPKMPPVAAAAADRTGTDDWETF